MASVEANGITIEYEDTGEADRPAISLIRGLSTQLCEWPTPFVDTLHSAGFRVVRHDNRDVGLTTKFADFGVPDVVAAMVSAQKGKPVPPPYTISDMAADVVGLLDALGIEKAHVVGMSMGGFIVQRLAAEHASRVASMTSIMSGSGNPDLPGPTPEAAAALVGAPADPDDRECVIRHGMDVLRVLGSPGYPQTDDELRAICTARYERCHHPEGAARQMLAILADGSRVDLLKEIQVPTLVIHGRDDPLVPVEAGIETAQLVAGARLELIDGMGHNIPDGLVPTLTKLIAEHARAN